LKDVTQRIQVAAERGQPGILECELKRVDERSVPGVLGKSIAELRATALKNQSRIFGNQKVASVAYPSWPVNNAAKGN